MSQLFLPEPIAEEAAVTVISVDDHLVEPPDMFLGRLPKGLQDRAPRVLTAANGEQTWEFDGRSFGEIGLTAVAGRVPSTVMGLQQHPRRFTEMRRGCWDITARIHDMDIGGIWASLNFPSFITGFCGLVYSSCSDPDLGLAVTRAYNDWLYEEWYSPFPERIIPCGITWLSDPVVGAQEIERNAARGFRSVTLPEIPQNVGFPSLFSGYWEPILQACAATDTVISLHVGSSGVHALPPDATRETGQLGWTLFGVQSALACAEWLWSGWTADIPKLNIVLSEGGIGWVPNIIERLGKLVNSRYNRVQYRATKMGSGGLHPADLLRRNFWFCSIDEPMPVEWLELIGVENILVESDYPHPDSSWPDTQSLIQRVWGDMPPAQLRRICSENAARLFRHPLPEIVRPLDRVIRLSA